jgi:hypothetical protein
LPRKFVQNLYAYVSSQGRKEFINYCQQFYEEEMSTWPEH